MKCKANNWYESCYSQLSFAISDGESDSYVNDMTDMLNEARKESENCNCDECI
jgi:hypothetical protein